MHIFCIFPSHPIESEETMGRLPKWISSERIVKKFTTRTSTFQASLGLNLQRSFFSICVKLYYASAQRLHSGGHPLILKEHIQTSLTIIANQDRRAKVDSMQILPASELWPRDGVLKVPSTKGHMIFAIHEGMIKWLTVFLPSRPFSSAVVRQRIWILRPGFSSSVLPTSLNDQWH